MNMGAADFLKQQKRAAAKGKLNKNLQGFQINEQAGDVSTTILKTKGKVGAEADQLFDAESLHDELKTLQKDLKFLHQDQVQVAKNIEEGKFACDRAKKGLNEVLMERKLIVNKGVIEKEPSPEDVVNFEGIDTAKMLA